MEYDLVVVGGGPAGLAAAYEAYNNGIEKILIIERDKYLGGILNQCIHNGFGLHTFKVELTGPEYADKFIKMIKSSKVEVMQDTMVMGIKEDNTINIINTKVGYTEIKTKAIVLAMGCRERTRGAINIPGDRPSGVFTAGAAQRYLNIDGYMPGKDVLILGSGDIGLIMARRMTLEGAKVHGVVELMPHSNGLQRNIVQCLEDFNIPLYLSHTVIDIVGKTRLEKVVIAEVDKDKKPIKGTEKTFDVDTLLLSVGLVPENELSKFANIEIDKRTNGLVVTESMETSKKGVFACGNVVHVHDLVDFVTEEAKSAGKAAASYLKGESKKGSHVNITNGEGINYTVPQKLNVDSVEGKLNIFMRVGNNHKNKKITARCGERLIAAFKREHLAPAEMERITIPKKLLQNINEDLIISIEEDN